MRFLNFLNHVILSDHFKIKDTKILNDEIKTRLGKFEMSPILKGIFQSSEFAYKDNKIKINNFPLAEFINHFRKLELDEAFSKIHVHVPQSTIKFLKESFPHNEPLVEKERVKKIKIILNDIEPQLKNIKNEKQFEIVYNKNSKLQKILSGLMQTSRFLLENKSTLIIGGVSIFIYRKVRQYQEEMYGCIKTQTINGVTTSCRDDLKTCYRKIASKPTTNEFISPCNSTLSQQQLDIELEKSCTEDNISKCYKCNSLELNKDNHNFIPETESAENIHYHCNTLLNFDTALAHVLDNYELQIEDEVGKITSSVKKYAVYFIVFVIFIASTVGVYYIVRFINNIKTVVPL